MIGAEVGIVLFYQAHSLIPEAFLKPVVGWTPFKTVAYAPVAFFTHLGAKAPDVAS